MAPSLPWNSPAAHLVHLAALAASEYEPAAHADGSVARWIEGMGKCRYCNGNHLNRDCTSDKAKAAA